MKIASTFHHTAAAFMRDTHASAPTTHETAESLNELAAAMVQGDAGKRQIATEILVNLAARNDDVGKKAQEMLRDVHANPTNYAEPGGLADHLVQAIRQDIESVAHALITVSLNAKDSGHNKVQHPLSVTVAYIAGQCRLVTRDEQSAIGQYLDEQITCESAEGAGRLGLTRLTGQSELVAASSAYKDVLPLDNQCCVQLDLDGKEGLDTTQARLAKAVQSLTAGLGKGQCKSVWLQTGSEKYPHWMPVVVQRAEDGALHYHIVNTDGGNPDRAKAISEHLKQLAPPTPGAKSQVHLSTWPMQTHAGNGCGVLGHQLLKSLAVQLREYPALARNGEAVSQFIDDYCKSQMRQPEADIRAQVVSTRAELLQAYADCASHIAQPEMSPRLEPAFALPGVVSPSGKPSLDGSRLPSGPALIQTSCDTLAERVNLGPPDSKEQRVGDEFRKLSQRVQDCALSAPRDRRNVEEMGRHAKALADPEPVIQQVLGATPLGLRKFARATMEQQALDHRLKDSPLLGLTQFAEKSAPQPPDLTQLGFGAVLSQGPTRFHELLDGLVQNADKDVASLAKGDPAKAFEAMAKDVTAYMDKRLKLLTRSVQQLDDILAAKPSLYDALAGKFNARVSMTDPRVQADAKALRAVLQAQIDALNEPDGAPQALLAFAKAAQVDPDRARTVFMSKVRPDLA